MHAHYIEDADGNLTDVIPFCSDSCHAEWCRVNRIEYTGWNGALEGSDDSEYCANCGVIASTSADACEHQRGNVVVNRFVTENGETCVCGNWIQLPADRIGK